MKLLLDTCISNKARSELGKAGHDVVSTKDYWEEDPGDEEIMARAYGESRILVTLDKDFGELAVVYDRPHAGIIRLVNLSATQQAAVCIRVLERYGEELQAGAIVTAGLNRVRIRSPEN
ncbi:MAG: DUF5615 family PIN-like protein [Anaerolineae bacterium]|nr:DUF5615 family PIN-like protein [Anaerolineae bacterium]